MRPLKRQKQLPSFVGVQIKHVQGLGSTLVNFFHAKLFTFKNFSIAQPEVRLCLLFQQTQLCRYVLVIWTDGEKTRQLHATEIHYSLIANPPPSYCQYRAQVDRHSFCRGCQIFSGFHTHGILSPLQDIQPFCEHHQIIEIYLYPEFIPNLLSKVFQILKHQPFKNRPALSPKSIMIHFSVWLIQALLSFEYGKWWQEQM